MVTTRLCLLTSHIMQTPSNEALTAWSKDYFILLRNLQSIIIDLAVLLSLTSKTICSTSLWLIDLGSLWRYCNALFLIYVGSCLHAHSWKIKASFQFINLPTCYAISLSISWSTQTGWQISSLVKRDQFPWACSK